jgi:hypothetical protein
MLESVESKAINSHALINGQTAALAQLEDKIQRQVTYKQKPKPR